MVILMGTAILWAQEWAVRPGPPWRPPLGPGAKEAAQLNLKTLTEAQKGSKETRRKTTFSLTDEKL